MWAAPSLTFTKNVPTIEQIIPVAASANGKMTKPIPASVLPLAKNIAEPEP